MSDHKEEAKGAAQAAAPAGGGVKAMLPLILSVTMMPVLAYAMTAFVIVPQLKSAVGAPAAPAGEEAHAEEGSGDGHGKSDGGHGAAEGGHGESAGGHGKSDDGHGGAAKVSKGAPKYPLQKLIVNLSGTSGTRFLMTSLTLVGEKKNFADVLEENKDQILDVTTGALGAKTIPDLEKPGARNQIRSELITVINNALGSDVVKEIYITEMAIQ